MCFNGPKTWQFGWFSNYYHVELNNPTNFLWSGNLIGFAERVDAGASDAKDKMIVKILTTTTGDDYYIHFNRKIGFNSGSLEGGNQVLVAKRKKGNGYGESTLIGKLNVGSVHVEGNFQESGSAMTVTFNSVSDGTPQRASKD